MYRLKMNSILTDEKDEKFFGNGPLYLLEGVREYGSLSASAKAMNMSYSKAFKLIKRSEEALGFKLLESVSGGKDGGSSVLSSKGEMFYVQTSFRKPADRTVVVAHRAGRRVATAQLHHQDRHL